MGWRAELAQKKKLAFTLKKHTVRIIKNEASDGQLVHSTCVLYYIQNLNTAAKVRRQKGANVGKKEKNNGDYFASLVSHNATIVSRVKAE